MTVDDRTPTDHATVGAEPALVARLRAGDERAFVALVRELDGLLRRLARGIVRSEAQVDDAVQDTWTAVVRGLGTFEGRSTLRTWICRILLNRARTAAVKDGRMVPASALAGDDDDDDAGAGLERFSARGGWAAPPAPWAEERPDVLADRAELVALTGAAIEALPERQRLVVVLRDVQGWTAEEVCNALDLSETNQRVLLHRARGRIRLAVEAELHRRRTHAMMTCREVTALAHDRVEGRLTRRQRLGTRIHLLMCKHCRRALRQLEATLALLRATRAAPAPGATDEAALVALFRARGGAGDDGPPSA